MMKFDYTCECVNYKGKPLVYRNTIITPTIQTARLVMEAWNTMGKGHFKYALGQSRPIGKDEKKTLVQSSTQPLQYFQVES